MLSVGRLTTEGFFFFFLVAGLVGKIDKERKSKKRKVLMIFFFFKGDDAVCFPRWMLRRIGQKLRCTFQPSPRPLFLSTKATNCFPCILYSSRFLCCYHGNFECRLSGIQFCRIFFKYIFVRVILCIAAFWTALFLFSLSASVTVRLSVCLLVSSCGCIREYPELWSIF